MSWGSTAFTSKAQVLLFVQKRLWKGLKIRVQKLSGTQRSPIHAKMSLTILAPDLGAKETARDARAPGQTSGSALGRDYRQSQAQLARVNPTAPPLRGECVTRQRQAASLPAI